MPYTSEQVGREEWANFIIEGLRQQAVVLQSGVRVVVGNGRSIHVPVIGDPATQWLSEGEEIDLDAAGGADLELVFKKVGALITATSEAVTDSEANLLDALGQNIVGALATTVDAAFIDGLGTVASKQPLGLLRQANLPAVDAAPDHAGLVRGSAKVREAGGTPDVAYVAPDVLEALHLATDGENRPLVGVAEAGAPGIVAGLRLYPSAAVPAGTALVADASEVVAGIRSDPDVFISADAGIASDSLLIRSTARVDVAVPDVAALCKVFDAA